MDAATRRNLEITQNPAGGAENTLASVLDCTVTPMGSRMLKRWLRHASALIRVFVFSASKLSAHCRISPPSCSRYCVRSAVRTLQRLALRTARPARSGVACHAFQQLPELRAQLELSIVHRYRRYVKMGEFVELRDLLERAIIDTPPVLVRDGGVIASGYNEELDEWRALADGATDYLGVWKSASVKRTSHRTR